MLSTQILKDALGELSAISKVSLCAYDASGGVVASTSEDGALSPELVRSFAESLADSQVVGENHLLKVLDEGKLIYIINARGETVDAYMIGRIAAAQIARLGAAYKEKHNPQTFFQKLLLGSFSLSDAASHARKLHIDPAHRRIVILIETSDDRDGAGIELLRGMYASAGDSHVISIEEKRIALIKGMEKGEGYDDILAIAHTIADMMNTEALLRVKVAYGAIASELKDVPKSYKEASLALDVGKIFYTEKNVFAYNTLGIGRLIHQLPVGLCRLFIDEIFGDADPADIDEEIISTVAAFFDNSLNISETARQLYMHRNTLVYRLEKLEKLTGLDVRVFDDALIFKVALMVVRYVKEKEKSESAFDENW